MWRFILTDSNFIPVGELLNASQRKVMLPLSKLSTASMRVRLDHPLADSILDGHGWIKGYRDGVLSYFGQILSLEEVADESQQSIAINSVGSGWIFQKRFVGKSTSGTAFTNTDRALIVKSLIDTANTENDTHISTTVLPISAGSAVTYTAGPYKTLLESINDLSAGVDGFDWRNIPRENFVGGAVTSQKAADFTAAPLLGSDRSDLILEYGYGRRTLKSYSHRLTRENEANRFFHMTSTGPSSVISVDDATSQATHGLMEAVVSADITDATMRNKLISAHLAIRTHHQSLISFELAADPRGVRTPQYNADFTIGDTIRARAVHANRVRFDGRFRIWAVDFTIEDNGLERPTLIVEEND